MNLFYTSDISPKSSIKYVFNFIIFVFAFVFALLVFCNIGKNIYSKNFYKAPVVFPLRNILVKVDDKGAPDSVATHIDTIIIDAGHGGEDGGATSAAGILEKDINLNIAKYLSEYFSLTDINVVMTRDSDVLLYGENEKDRKKYYDLQNRIKIASAYENAVFISIHQNKFPIEKYYGLQVYYSKNDPESKVFAKEVQDKAREYLQPNNNRKVKEAGREIRVLDSLHMPAILVECGFLSNEKEAQMLSEKDYQRKIAFTIFISVMKLIG